MQKRLNSCLLFGFVFILQVVSANATSCNPSGKSILYAVELCSSMGCKKGREKMTIIGDRVLLYNAPSQPVGLTFVLEKSVDLCRPEFGDQPFSLPPEYLAVRPTAAMKMP